MFASGTVTKLPKYNSLAGILNEQTKAWMRTETVALSATACLESMFWAAALSLDPFGFGARVEDE